MMTVRPGNLAMALSFQSIIVTGLVSIASLSDTASSKRPFVNAVYRWQEGNQSRGASTTEANEQPHKKRRV